MSKLKLFIENFLVYGLGGIISKIIPFVMIPIITRLMPSTDYFGISDLSNTVVQFGRAFAVLGMYDAMYRMFFEKEEISFQKRVCSTALVFTFCTSLVVFLLMVLLRETIATYFFSDAKYAYVVYLSAMATLVGGTNAIIAAPTRMQNKRKVFLVANTAGPLISYAVAVPLLLAGYYVIALPLAGVVSSLTVEIAFGILNRSWFDVKKFDKALLKEMLMIAIPLLPNFLIYWVFDSCNKVMITNMIGIGAAGVYSVGSKLGHASQLIYTAFAGGWQYFAFSTMKEENQVQNNSLVFEYLGVISFVATAFACAWSYELFHFLFTKDYWPGYIIAPYLFLAPLLLMLFQVASNQFLVIKRTWPCMLILSIGAIVNIVLNQWLIPLIGIEGAAIDTLLGYVITDVVLVLVLLKIKLIVLSKRFLFVAFMMLVYFLVWRLLIPTNIVAGTVMAVAFLALCLLLYRKEIGMIVGKIKARAKR